MKKFISVKDASAPLQLAAEGLQFKQNPHAQSQLGRNKTLGLIFMNPSLRTRLSTQIAARNLGMEVMVMNIDREGWALEFGENVVMNGSTVEHVKDAAAVLGGYCDIIGIRSFPRLVSREEDYSEHVIESFIRYSGVPVVSLESATRHPLQSLADLMSILETSPSLNPGPKVVLAWAPHIRALPQAVPNSFAEWISAAGLQLTIAQPKGMELAPQFTTGATISYNLREAVQDADYVYVKNWSSYSDYGKTINVTDWLLNEEMLKKSAKIMHCLPVRRNLELKASLLDSEHSLVQTQAKNRIYAAQAVLARLLSQT